MKIFFQVNKKKRTRGRHSKRRLEWLHHIQEYVWPSIGVKAFLRYMEIKLKRARGSAHTIALGFSMGVFASFTPFMGLHALIAIALAVPFGGSAIMAIIGTIIGNPWTFPFIWLSSYNLGNFLLGRAEFESLPETFSFAHIWENISMYSDAYILPMFVGGAPMGALAATFFYILLFTHLSHYRTTREKYLKERRSKLSSIKQKAVTLSEKARLLKVKLIVKKKKDDE
ncbi:MAG: hypothetical protein ACI9TY_000348 [Alphaproteobacteria bacterium]|jgi:uncharacterized protein (DUF2062 family)